MLLTELLKFSSCVYSSPLELLGVNCCMAQALLFWEWVHPELGVMCFFMLIFYLQALGREFCLTLLEQKGRESGAFIAKKLLIV